jgi:hypothetical protein
VIKIIYVDPSINIDLPPGDIVLSKQEQYLSGYDRIVSAIHSHEDITVIITNKQIKGWLSLIPKRYGGDKVSYEEITLKGQLGKQIGIVIPEKITDQQIRESRLLDLHIPVYANTSFEDYLLIIFFGDFLVSQSGMKKIGDIVSSFDQEQWKDALDRPLIQSLFHNKILTLQSLLTKEHRTGEKIILDWLYSSPQLLFRNLSGIKILQNYPEALGKNIFGVDFTNIRDLKLDYRKIPVVSKGNDRVFDEIRLYLATQKNLIGVDDLNRLLNEISGFLEVEFEAVYKILQNGQIIIDNGLIERIRSKFKPLQDVPSVSLRLSELDLLITRSKPAVPQDNWSEEEWMEWASQSYLPYRFWLENTGKLDNEIAEIAGIYSDWFYKKFGSMKFSSKHMAWKWLLDQSKKWDQQTSPILIVMADNLNTKFYSDMQQQLKVQGFYEQQLDYCFSMIPSCTEVSKKCIITGHHLPFPESAYKNQVEGTWSTRFKNKKILYVGSIGAFREISQREHDIYFLNYLPFDITLHQDDGQTGISHSQSIRNFLVSLAQDIRAFSERIAAERDLTVIVISDHGSTRIPKGTVNVIQGNYYRKHAENEHQRYIALPDEEISKLPKNYEFDCYLLDRKVTDLETNYLIARRLYRFLPTDGNLYIHGGLTPEETIIPCAVYQPVIVAPKPLVITSIGKNKLYVGSKFVISLEITNLNNYPCEEVCIELLHDSIQPIKIKLGNIGKLVRIPIDLASRCEQDSATGMQKLLTRMTFEFLGQTHVHESKIAVEITDPAAVKFDLDDL